MTTARLTVLADAKTPPSSRSEMYALPLQEFVLSVWGTGKNQLLINTSTDCYLFDCGEKNSMKTISENVYREGMKINEEEVEDFSEVLDITSIKVEDYILFQCILNFRTPHTRYFFTTLKKKSCFKREI